MRPLSGTQGGRGLRANPPRRGRGRGLLLAALAVAAGPVGAMPADQARVDAAALDACVAAATDAADCAGSGQAACVARLRDVYRDVGPVDGRGLCLLAERDYWDARLTASYGRLVAREEGRGENRAEALRRAERAWIAFRDSLCAYEGLVLADRSDVAEPACLMRETARQSQLIDRYLSGGA